MDSDGSVTPAHILKPQSPPVSRTSAYRQGSAASERSSGLIRCQRCREVCKGEVVRVQETHFHVKCFTCTGTARGPRAGGPGHTGG
ncbi:Actin-binding LIM protein 3 [Liparis tanakae]|uniref:Actin-binding LIM protein 3 n=1 Tax=Liparis tanakae TaxID=230148 RepID=A0A4Z2EZK9_9TELE|nr:Actin-binding LIM protein 3 [Liparis tanakae]